MDFSIDDMFETVKLDKTQPVANFAHVLEESVICYFSKATIWLMGRYWEFNQIEDSDMLAARDVYYGIRIMPAWLCWGENCSRFRFYIDDRRVARPAEVHRDLWHHLCSGFIES